MEASMSVTSLVFEPETERVQFEPAPTKSPQAATRPPRAAIAGVWHWVMALVDQALVSGTRFLATIIVGRCCGPRELGTYSLAFSLLVLGGCFQEAIVTTPYAVLGQRLRRRSRSMYAGAIARMHFSAAVGGAILLVALAVIGLVFKIQ